MSVLELKPDQLPLVIRLQTKDQSRTERKFSWLRTRKIRGRTKNKFVFDTRGLAIYVGMTEEQVREERKSNYAKSLVPMPK